MKLINVVKLSVLSLLSTLIPSILYWQPQLIILNPSSHFDQSKFMIEGIEQIVETSEGEKILIAHKEKDNDFYPYYLLDDVDWVLSCYPGTINTNKTLPKINTFTPTYFTVMGNRYLIYMKR